MQQILFIVITVFFLIVVIRQCLYWSWLLQLKEYRIDRILAHFNDIGPKSSFASLIGYTSLKHYKFPKFTIKAIMIIILSFLSGIGFAILVVRSYFFQIQSMFFEVVSYLYLKLIILANSLNHPFLNSVLLYIKEFLDDYGVFTIVMSLVFIFMPIIIIFFMAVFNILSGILKAVTINRARRRIAKYPNIKIVGVTGSYGKSTTKEILADILSKKYKVLKTPANNNTVIGIAQLILNKLDENCEIFIIEMGAYKVGEIKEICDMVRPTIGVITAINEQHLALFGSIKNTIKAKFELVDCLPKTGLAVLNIGDANIQAGMELRKNELNSRVKLYSVGAKADVYAIGEASDRQSVKFKYISGAIMKDFTLNMTGIHNTSNALAAIIVANDLGMDLEEISQILQKNSYLDVGLKNSAGPNGSTLIDDTYNANPDGVLSVLKHIKNQRGRKILVMSSLIELGSSAHEIHRKIGEEISKIAAKVYLLDNYYSLDIKKGAMKNEDSILEIKTERDVKKIAEILKNELKPSDTALFINRGARKVLEMLNK